MCLNGIPSLIKVSPQRQVAVLLNNSAATCLELQQFEEALLHSSTVVLLQVADEGLLSKAPLWVSWWLSPTPIQPSDGMGSPIFRQTQCCNARLFRPRARHGYVEVADWRD